MEILLQKSIILERYPSIGKVNFNKNITVWTARSTDKLDYWITAGDSPSEIEKAYADVSGKVPMMPDYGMGVLAM